MLEDLYSKVDFTKKVRFQTGEEDKTTDIGGNTDNVTIYDNYCTEESTPSKLQENTGEDHQQAVSVSEGSRKRNLPGAAAVFLGQLCLFFLTAVIVLLVLWIADKSKWNTERNWLQADNVKLISERDKLQTSYTEIKSLNANLTQNTRRLENENDFLKAVNLNLTKEIDELQKQIEPPCPANWIRICKTCYFLSTSTKNWTDSKTFCEGLDAHLVIISSFEEQVFASSFQADIWIGLTDAEQEGKWKWVNGQRVNNTYWGNNQPDNAGSGEHCVEISQGKPNSNWNDLYCYRKLNFLCEIET